MLFSDEAPRAAVHQAICRAFLPSVLATFLPQCSISHPHREAIARRGRIFHSERETGFQNRTASQRLTLKAQANRAINPTLSSIPFTPVLLMSLRAIKGNPN